MLHLGADHTIKNLEGLTALDLATKANHKDVIDVLTKHTNGTPTPPLSEEEKKHFTQLMLRGVGREIIELVQKDHQYLWVESKGTIIILH